ncbi:Regulator of cytoskeleton and endocytosis [Vanrija pseudolonga]|uniref:Regulator of cytoskeleton and endocytosis n=1 Tax=Vanrija pseudolonga TaxID=143232 RepID=A0AAF0YAI2_9TREE|nr:Regulator of cytoskeleton and endocytosis [Vanrija pseudolonga]
MKGMTKALQRTPHNLTSKFGMSKKSTDAEYNDWERKFAAIEAASEKMHKDSVVFRDAVTSLLTSGNSFSGSLATLFAPIGNEYNLASKFPQSEVTIKNIASYQRLMEELKETLQPELDLIESRIVQPSKELNDICKKIRKTCTKRDHKLVDYDRHNNSLNKLRDKKEKSLKDEKNLFKVEQDFELAAGEYEHYNNLLKTELPEFLRMATQFVDPLFHSFYYMQLNVYYIMLEKLQSFTDGKYDLERRDIENVYFEQRGEAGEQLEELGITKRLVTTAKLLQQSRGGSAVSRNVSSSSKADLARKESTGGSYAARNVSAPPPYSAASAAGKKAPPPPPPLKPKPGAAAKVYCTAIFDYEAQAAGDLSFSAGDRIEIVERTDSAEDWWTGRLDGRQGIFPGNYTQVD